MAFGGDPYRVLGLSPGVSQAEIKRAYRRLAKAFHPDAAGEGAIPRFLAIQAAYDQLIGQPTGPGTAGRPGPSWQADASRARASRGRAGGPAGGREGAAGAGGTAGRPGAGGPAGARSRRGNRQPGRATPGSTTYDEADVDPFDPEWSGGSWYGTTSGTYWTINPREYADPRKHGPEYQARARRTSSEPPGPEPAAAPTGTGRASPYASPQPPPPPAPEPEPIEPALPLDPLAALPLPGGGGRRVAVALLGWPPIGVAIAWLLGELSGCGRFSAGCVETFAVGTWVAQFAVLGALLLLPPLAAASAVGTVALLAAAIPASILLSAVGGAREPGAAAGALAIVLAIAWLAGAAFAVGRRSRTIPP